MAIETAYLGMMPSTIQIQRVTSADKYGKPTFGTGTSVRCRIVPTASSSRNANGVDITEQGRIYCYGTPTVDVDDRIVLPGGKTVFAVAVQVQNDETGSHHTVITIGSGR